MNTQNAPLGHWSPEFPPQEFSFTDRESYLAWVKEWKEEVAYVVEEVRRVKAERRKPHRRMGKFGVIDGVDGGALQDERNALRVWGRRLYWRRECSKVRAGQLRKERLSTVV